MKKQNKAVVATGGNVSRSLRSGRPISAVPHFERSANELTRQKAAMALDFCRDLCDVPWDSRSRVVSRAAFFCIWIAPLVILECRQRQTGVEHVGNDIGPWHFSKHTAISPMVKK